MWLEFRGESGVDQRGPPVDGGAQVGFGETRKLLKWRHQGLPLGSNGHDSGLRMQEAALSMPGHRFNILHAV